MTNIDPKLVDEIFRAALELPAHERSSFVAGQCGDNEALRERVDDLLIAADSDVDPLASLVEESRAHLFASLADDSDQSEDLSGLSVGRWRIEKPLARGGLATVYVAHRDDGHYEQRVAFKVLRRGLDTDDVIARFRAERQILSTMEHPAIAQMLDGGTLDDGRPYLVLEYVDGESITEYCSANKVGVRDRVKLIIDVLEALHHAHQHLIVHRDIKPSNIMVSTAKRVMLLDFGIAKLLDPGSIPGGSTLTRTGIALLTPMYGSPEQHAGEPVTTASDIYQVGGVLYELLAGKHPPSGATVAAHSIATFPSREARGTGRRSKIKGDLDAIVSKAMQGDPSKRYASATEMIADLKRFLAGRPIHARPDTLAYRFYKLVRRRPLLLPAALAVIVTTTGYIVTLNNHNRDIRIEQERAAAAQAFMIDLLGSANPYGPSDRDRGKDILVVDALDVGLERLRTDAYGGDDKLRAALLSSIAEVYGDLDKHQAAIQTHLEALALERELFGSVSEPVLLSLRELAHQYRTVGDYAEAGDFYGEQLSIAQQLYAPDDPRLALAEAASGLYEFRLANKERATQLMESAVATLRNNADDYAIDLIDAIVTLARIRGDTSLESTLEMLVEARDFADRTFGPDSPLAGLTRTQYATSATLNGNYAEAEQYFDEAIGIYETRLGRDHGATLIALLSLGRLYFAMGEFATAEVVQREVYGHYVRKYGLHQGGVAEAAQELGHVLSAQGRFDEAIQFHQQAYESYLVVLGDNNVRVYAVLVSLARVQIQAGLLAEAQTNAALAVDNLNRIQPDSDLLFEAQRLLETLANPASNPLP